MSYILDALNKSQAEQSSQDATLSLQQAPPRNATQRWLAPILIMILLVNTALVLWVVWPTAEPSNVSAATEVAPVEVVQTQRQMPAADQQAGSAGNIEETIEQSSPISPPAQQTQPAAIPKRTPTPLAQASDPTPTAEPATDTANINSSPTLDRFALQTLPTDQQSLYQGFNYSTHIYTDDPSLCAIVINGQRLQAGDTFETLKIVEITETGVIFEEQHEGGAREVEVSVLDQWDAS